MGSDMTSIDSWLNSCKERRKCKNNKEEINELTALYFGVVLDL